ncbi:hypothetical protein [Paenibacillus cisolokensis]|nr:hypothetical protein [Paenibacillus cisolokensis]
MTTAPDTPGASGRGRRIRSFVAGQKMRTYTVTAQFSKEAG